FFFLSTQSLPPMFYTLSLHDALPIFDAADSIEQVDDTHIKFRLKPGLKWSGGYGEMSAEDVKYSFERIADPKNESPYKDDFAVLDRKSTRLNSSHVSISYAVFCLKKK